MPKKAQISSTKFPKKTYPQASNSVTNTQRSRNSATYSAVAVNGTDTEDETNSIQSINVSPQQAAATALSTPGKKGKKKAKKKARKGDANDKDDDESVELKRKFSPVLAPLPHLTKHEYEFFEMVRSGDVDKVERFLGSDEFQQHIKINKTDKTGYTVLHVAVHRQDEPMVRLLVRLVDIRLYDTLLHAIKEHNVEITKILLEIYDRNQQITASNNSPGGTTLNKPSTSATALATANTSVAPRTPALVTPISARSGVVSTFKMTTSTTPSGKTNPTSPPSQTISSRQGPSSTSRSKNRVPQASVSLPNNEDEENGEIPFDSAFPPVITPLMLAAQEGCYPLMELFYERGERLESDEYPHTVGCDCDICAKLEGDQDMTRAYQRYHLFKALTQPDYICFIARKEKKDPVNYALQMIIKVREIIALDIAFNRLFHDFEEQLEDFISKLMQLCRNTTETEIFLCPKDAEEKERLPHLYPRLWYTVGLDLKKFVAQPNVQNLVYKLWASDDWPDWDTFGWIYRTFNIVIRVLAFPLIALVLLLAQDTGIGRTLGAPISRFLTYIGSYIFFLVLVGIQALFPYQRCNGKKPYYSTDDSTCTERGPPSIGTEWPLVIYIMSFYVSMLKRHSVSWYWSKRWNWFELISQVSFTITFLCWAWSFLWTIDESNKQMLKGTKRTMWPHDSPEVFSECFLAVSFLLAGCRLLRFFTVLPELGPIQIALGKQIIDFLSTGLIMIVVIFAFASGMMALFVPYMNCGTGIDPDDHNREKAQGDAFQNPSNAIKTLFFMLYSHGGPDVVKLLTWRSRNGTDENSVTVEISHKYTAYTAQFLFLSYHVIGVTMLFSMLSGYFSQTVEQVMENVDVEWKYARTELYLTFIKDTVLPPPFNLLPTLKAVASGIKYLGLMGKKEDPKAACSFRQCCYITANKKTQSWRRLMTGYRSLIVQLMYRYRNLREEEAGEAEATKDDVLELGEELAEIKAMLKRTKGESAQFNGGNDDDDDFPSGGGGGQAGTGGAFNKWKSKTNGTGTPGPTAKPDSEAPNPSNSKGDGADSSNRLGGGSGEGSNRLGGGGGEGSSNRLGGGGGEGSNRLGGGSGEGSNILGGGSGEGSNRLGGGGGEGSNRLGGGGGEGSSNRLGGGSGEGSNRLGGGGGEGSSDRLGRGGGEGSSNRSANTDLGISTSKGVGGSKPEAGLVNSDRLSLLFVAQSSLLTPKRSSGLINTVGSGEYTMDDRGNNNQGPTQYVSWTDHDNRGKPDKNVASVATQDYEMMNNPSPEKKSGIVDFSGLGDDFHPTNYAYTQPKTRHSRDSFGQNPFSYNETRVDQYTYKPPTKAVR